MTVTSTIRRSPVVARPTTVKAPTFSHTTAASLRSGILETVNGTSPRKWDNLLRMFSPGNVKTQLRDGKSRQQLVIEGLGLPIAGRQGVHAAALKRIQSISLKPTPIDDPLMGKSFVGTAKLKDANGKVELLKVNIPFEKLPNGQFMITPAYG